MRLFGTRRSRRLRDRRDRAALDRDAALRKHRAAEAEFRRLRGLPENTIICGQDSDPGRLGKAARDLKRLGLR